jgi:nucleoside-diphosphate kinase
MDRTLLIIKPDAVERGLMGEIINRLEKKGFKFVAGKLGVIDRKTAETHYAEHSEKSFYRDLVDFITRSPSFVGVLEYPENAWAALRKLMGETDPNRAQPGTIRGDLGSEITQNLVHGSDSKDSAQREIKLFFPSLQQ